MPSVTTQTDISWSVEYDTLRRNKLYKNPPRDRSAFPLLQAAVRPHVESFNAIFDDNDDNLINKALADIGTHTVVDGDPKDASRATPRNTLQLRVSSVSLEPAKLPDANRYSVKREIYPAECRERHSTYRGLCKGVLEYRINNGEWSKSTRTFGQLPLMVRSNRCHLQNFTPEQMVEHKEDSEEMGGYFIVNGNEKVVRLLIMPKRNYPLALIRNSFTARGPTFSKYAVSIRSARPDQTSQTIVLHYLTDGNVTVRFSWRKNEYYMPVIMILKALVETNDRDVAAGIMGTATDGQKPNSFVAERTELLLRTFKAYNLKSRSQTLAYIGEKFRPVLGISINVTDEKAGEEFLRRVVLPHLGNVDVTEAQNHDKFQLMLFMIRKLYSLAAGDCTGDNPDAVANHEVLLSGFLYGMILKEAIAEWLASIGIACQDHCRSKNIDFADKGFQADLATKVMRKVSDNLAGKLEYFLSTGNLVTPTGLDQSQTSGFCIVAEKINFYRFISHFRCIHRGAFFAELKTTTVRKLMPESWGFLCPVHTPDGAPCGLLNHLAHQCVIPTQTVDTRNMEKILSELGLEPVPSMSEHDSLAIQLDGRILGYCPANRARDIAQLLRYWKVNGENSIPVELEIGHVPTSNGGLYPGLYLFTQPARMIRPVRYMASDKLDYVGPFEQQYLNIACTPEDIISNLTTHMEYTPTNILSILANMTPFSDFNQSPRNMYQCQMSKQTMGTPSTNLMYRTDNKAYLLQTGQTPVVRPPLYNAYGLDNYPNGTNAVVAVISYTGYDMDDAMIINKTSHERGFGDGVIYKTKMYPLSEESSRSKSRSTVTSIFGFHDEELYKKEDRAIKPEAFQNLNSDGLPFIGLKVQEGSIILASHNVMYNPTTNEYDNFDGKTSYIRYKDSEDAYVDQIRLLGDDSGDQPCQAVSIKFRIPRRPVIGDKFSSRHGQKGVLSFLWPSQDMPFSESGIQPDVIINPHAFPSRMTIGMFIESLAGKSGALHGLAQDCTPFTFSEDHTAGDFFGEQLSAAGYNFYGNEPMYSGVTGKEFAADIYLGVVYYQRLRHMVNDKFQVRTTGPVNALTGQPVKGRQKGGGIRVGEMERDSLLAHGCAFLLQDRLMDCSDKTRAWVCRQCGSFLATMMVPNQFGGLGKRIRGNEPSGLVRCRACAREAQYGDSKMDTWEDGNGRRFCGGDDTTVLNVPGVLRYLDVELGAMGIKMQVKVEN